MKTQKELNDELLNSKVYENFFQIRELHETLSNELKLSENKQVKTLKI
jgi:hypothetical protein